MEDEGRHGRADTGKEINCGVFYLEPFHPSTNNSLILYTGDLT